MAHEEEEPRKVQYPLDQNSYRILGEIGSGVSAIVYKAICLLNSTVVAIKSIDLDQTRADFDNVRREAKIMSLLSHPNILRAHCSFTVDSRLWVVMPFMSAGSLQSIIYSSFPDGLSEPCIAVVLKETLHALSYLHDQGHLHRDIKAGNILIDSTGSVKLGDFGVSASIYEWNSTMSSSMSSSSSSQLLLTDLAGTPYWMAPEVIHSHVGYSFKADIWSFGITALELAHGRPPLSHLPPSKSLLMKITKRFRFSDYEKNKKDKNKKFSKSFKDMVASCLDQDPSKRPSAEKLLKHSFFKNCKGLDFLVKNVLHGLPAVEERFKEAKVNRRPLIEKGGSDDEDDAEGFSLGDNIVKHRRISGWNFNEDGFELVPVFPTERDDDDNVVKQVRFGGETIIRDKVGDSNSEASNPSTPVRVVDETQVGDDTVEEASEDVGSIGTVEVEIGGGSVEGEASMVGPIGVEPVIGGGGGVDPEAMVESMVRPIGVEPVIGGGAGVDTEAMVASMVGPIGVEPVIRGGGGVDPEAMVASLVFLSRSLDDQKQKVMSMISMIRGEEAGVELMSIEEQMMQVVERLRMELEVEKKKNFELEMELEFLKIQITGAAADSAGGDPSGNTSGAAD